VPCGVPLVGDSTSFSSSLPNGGGGATFPHPAGPSSAAPPSSLTAAETAKPPICWACDSSPCNCVGKQPPATAPSPGAGAGCSAGDSASSVESEAGSLATAFSSSISSSGRDFEEAELQLDAEGGNILTDSSDVGFGGTPC